MSDEGIEEMSKGVPSDVGFRRDVATQGFYRPLGGVSPALPQDDPDFQAHAASCDECHATEYQPGEITVLPCPQAAKLHSRKLKAKLYAKPDGAEPFPRVLHDRIMVRPIEKGEEKRGNIIIPETAKEKPNEGEVLVIGNGRLLESGQKIAVDVNVGDHVLYGRYSGTELRIDEKTVIILREDEVLCVL